MNDDVHENNAAIFRKNKNKTAKSRSFEYIGSAIANNNTLGIEVVVLLKHLSNFWRSHDLSLIMCEIKPDFK